MTLNLYVMPLTGSGTKQSPRQPKYLSTFQAFQRGWFEYGSEPACLVGVVNIDAPTDATLDAFPDCSGLPTNLDATVGGARTTIQNALEAVNMPGTWVQTTNTWRDVVLFIGAACQFAQRFQGNVGGRWFTGGVTLDSTFNSLGASVRNGLTSTAQSFNLDTSGITGTSTLRQIIQSAAQQLVAMDTPIILAGVSLYDA